MKVLKIVIVMLILIMSAGAVCAAENVSDDAISDGSQEILKITQTDTYRVGEASFTNLTDEIESTGVSLDLNQDYAFNNETDNKTGIAIVKDNFVLNGNGHTIDAKNQSRIFNITANNVILSNLILKNGNAKNGGAIYSNGTLTLNNVTFTNNYATSYGGAVALFKNVTLNCDDVRFIDNYGGAGSSIYVDKGNLTLYNSYITSNIFSKRGQIVFKKSKINVENTTFTNIVSSYTPALFISECKEAYIINSKFINLMANISAGALAVKDGGYIYIEDCEFANTTSTKNAGAILADIAGNNELNGNVTVLNTIFKDTYSEFGGAYIQLGGNLFMNNTEFINSHATFNGGAVYLSYTDSEISNCNFTSNGVELNDQGYPTYGGAVLCDISTLNVDNTNFINNTASAGSAIYAYDSAYAIKNSLFEDNINPIYTFFDKESILENNAYINDDNISTNNTIYSTIRVGQGLQLTLLNNSIIVTTLPARFDLRDYGWVTPVRDQGWMGSCWTFGMTSALESSLLKATGISADFSENNMQNTMIRYSIYGTPNLCEGGMNTYSASYLLSWLGAFPQDADTYDEIGKISPVITTLNDIHVQDVMFIPNNEIPNGTQIKQAIMKYGALDVSYFGQSTYDEKNPYYNPDTYAQYVNVTKSANHEVSVVGWDDNFPKEKFLITPPGNGAWIIKNSWDTDWGDNGYLYVSYYDKSFLGTDDVADYATAIIIENTEPYNKNYQYDLIWTGKFLANPFGGNVSYYNEFEALDDDLIAAVGTYFDQSGVDYKVEIFVNDILKLTQEGVSPYLGYHTIKLNEYIPIKQGDIFKAVMTSNVMPYTHVKDTRTHYTENLSFASFDGQTWEDVYVNNGIICIKVYTVENPIAENTFTALQNLISSSENYLELSDDYYFNNETDENIGISILKDNFVLNGNGHTIDAKNQSKIFSILANNVTLSNLILINGNGDSGAAVYVEKSATLDNITFIDNRAASQGGAVRLYGNAALNINNSRFINNTATLGSAILIINGNLNIYNTEFTSEVYSKRAQIFIAYGTGYVENVTFANIVSNYDPAIHLEEAKGLSVINSKFINLMANISAGAIGVKCGCDVYIRNCEFINTTSSKNAGAILADIAGNKNFPLGNVTIIDTVFRDTSSGFGGAYIQLGGNLFMNNTEFINSHATFNGGAVYISFVDNAEISNCNFTSNGVEIFEGYPTYGGAMVIDMSVANIDNCRFINNTASAGNAIYAYDSSYNIRNSIFENNTNPICTFFDKESILENNIYINNDNISTNNTFYATIIAGEGLQLTLLNNTINLTVIPTRFDLRDWGWVSPVRDQGMTGSCWTFGMTGTLESALLKAAGITTDFSENNMQNTMLRYSIYGTKFMFEGGWNFISTSYLLSWLGAFTQDADTYDELGKLSPTITTGQDIHVQDVMFTPNNEIPNGTQLKLAIMNYGSIDVSYYGQSTYDEKNPYYNPDTYAQYVNETTYPSHAVSIIGWDDSFPKEKFLITPPGDGAWIVKNSWGPTWGDNGYLYVSYYDKSLIISQSLETHATSIIIENTEPYNKNYQYNLIWAGEFIPVNGTISYINEFEALDDDMIAAVGTYFNQSGINYTVEIYVNDELKLTQEGISPYYGYHTIKLNEYIPIKQGDIFDAVITSNNIPILRFEYTRVHYTENISFVSDGKEIWNDTYELGYIACLKVYTVAIAEKMNTTISSDVEVNNSAVTVTVNINPNATGFVEYTLNGTSIFAKVIDGKSTLYCILPAGNYTITATYLGDDAFNGNTTDIEVIIADETAVGSQFSDITIGEDLSITLVLKDGNGNIIANAPITYSINGTAFTNTTADDGSVVIPAVTGEKIEIQYAGNETVLPTNLTLTLNVPVSPVVVKVEARFDIANRTITIKGYAIDTDAGEEGIYYATTLLDANGKPIANAYIEFAVNDKIYSRTTYENGSFKPYKLNMKSAGRYTMAFNFAGDDNYTNAFACVCVDLDKKPIQIKASNKSYKATAKTKSYTATLSTIVGSSHDGKVHLKSLKVSLKVNGKTYTGKTNSKGEVTFKITNLSKKGKFSALISYEGDKTYEAQSKTVVLTIN